MAEFADLFISMFVLTLWIPASSFADDIKSFIKIDEPNYKNLVERERPVITLHLDVSINENEKNGRIWSKIYPKFQSIQNLSHVQNNAIGTRDVTSDMLNRFVKLGYFMYSCFNLYLSDVCSKMEAAKLWLIKRKNIKSVPFDEAYLVMQESITKNIGMCGSDYFTIKFGTILAYLSLIATFFVICVQQKDFE